MASDDDYSIVLTNIQYSPAETTDRLEGASGWKGQFARATWDILGQQTHGLGSPAPAPPGPGCDE